MSLAEIYEEIRALLKDVQTATVDAPYTYSDDDLLYPLRSALRWARTKGVDTDADLALNGTLSPTPTETVGVLLSYRVASQLLRGDMISKLGTGELGLYFRAGDSIIDTKTAATVFRGAAKVYDDEVRLLLSQILSSDVSSAAIFGDDTLSV